MIVIAMGLASPGDSQAADEFIEFVEDRNINDRRCELLRRRRMPRHASRCAAGMPSIAPACRKWDGKRQRRLKQG
jgi:hypothetical protein